MNIVVLGAGGIGGYVGALLARAGQNVAFVDRWAENVRAIEQAGLAVSGQESFTVRVPAHTELHASAQPVDLLIVAVKNVETRAALEAVAGLEPAGVTTLQNGLDVLDPLFEAYGRERVFGLLTLTSGSLLGPGQVRGFTGERPTFAGELDGRRSARIEALQQACAQAGLPVVIPDDITAVRWSKMVWWIPLVCVPAVTRLTLGQALTQRDSASLFTHIERECAAAAARLGHAVRDYPPIEVARRLALPFEAAVDDVVAMGRRFEAEGMGSYEVAMLLDLKRRRKTEVDNTAGVIVREAQRLGLAVPYTEFAWRAIRAVESAF